MSQPPVGFIGLGNLGAPMARNLVAAGFPVRVYNRTAEKARSLAEQGATVARSTAGVASPGGVVITIVSDDAAVREVCDDGMLAALGRGGIHLSMSTILPATAEELARSHARHGVTYVAAPVFGRPEAAAAKKLWICTSGPDAEAKARVRPLLDAMGQGVFDFGPGIGSANVIKLAGNFMITAMVEVMAEACALGEKTGIPREALLDFFGQTLFNSPVFNNYARRLIAADFDNVGFTSRLALKDMRLGLETALAAETPMPVLGLLRDRYLAALANGEGELDASALALRAAEDAGLSWFERREK
jgi:3-hydroxyisobutyrate dehydrogenase-like beta-hydroxyacid dehydrogenase